MTNKITLTIIAVIATIIIAPTAYAELWPTQDRFNSMCNNKANDGKITIHDYQCGVNIYQMYFDIAELFTTISDHENRLQILEGKVPPPQIGDPLTMFVIPDTISAGERFVVHGHVDRVEQSWVDFVIYNPNGIQIQAFDIETLQNGGYYPPAIVPNNNWNISGNYTITATHGPHSESVTIQYLGENP